jgi:hypothetical protein
LSSNSSSRRKSAWSSSERVNEFETVGVRVLCLISSVGGVGVGVGGLIQTTEGCDGYLGRACVKRSGFRA